MKYDACGNLIWAATGNSSIDDRAYGCAVDAHGDLYVTGNFSSLSLAFGNDTLNITPGNLNSDLFITKIDSSGAFEWSKSTGLHDMDRGVTCAADWHGNIYVAGVLSTDTAMQIVMGSDTLATPDTPTPSTDVLVFKIECNDCIHTGMPSVNTEPAIHVFPNPTNGIATIAGIEKATVNIYNFLGELVTHSTGLNTVDLSSFNDGLYFIQLLNKNNMPFYNSKILLQK